MNCARNLTLKGLTLCFGLSIALLGAELWSRALGHEPWPFAPIDQGPPDRHEKNNRRGWIPKPTGQFSGTYGFEFST